MVDSEIGGGEVTNRLFIPDVLGVFQWIYLVEFPSGVDEIL